MTTARLKEAVFSEKSLLPLGAALALCTTAALGAWKMQAFLAESSAAQREQAYQFERLAIQFNHGLSEIRLDLASRSRARWTYDMEMDSWSDFERKNRANGIVIPDIRAIKKAREE